MSENTITFTPPASVEPFLLADKFANFIVGPVGSTKTSGSIMKIAYEASRVAPCKDGIRRSRCVVVRNTREQLRDTTIPDFLKWFPDGVAGAYIKTEGRFILRISDIECEVLFRGLDEANDVRRLLSLQLTFGFMDEFREINPDIYNALTGRLGRYPDKSMNGVGCVDDEGNAIYKVWGSTNPPDEGTFWEELLTDPPENMSVTFQPSGLSAEADWLHYLPDGYYENLAKGKSEAWINVYIHGKFGESLSGKPVFRCFNPAVHVAKNPMQPNRVSSNPIIIGFDCTGLNPAAVIGQLGFESRAYVYDTIYATDMGVLRFIREKLKPLLANKYAGMSTAIIIDPAGMARDSEERTVKDMLAAEGLIARPARTNLLAPRLAAVENLLTRFVDGNPGLVICPNGSNADLIAALRNRYRFKINTKGEASDTPDKAHPWGDIADAFQYFCLHADGGTIFGGEMKRQAVTVHAAPRGWAR